MEKWLVGEVLQLDDQLREAVNEQAIPLPRIAHADMGCLPGEFRTAGHLVPQTNPQMSSECVFRLYYKPFA